MSIFAKVFYVLYNIRVTQPTTLFRRKIVFKKVFVGIGFACILGLGACSSLPSAPTDVYGQRHYFKDNEEKWAMTPDEITKLDKNGRKHFFGEYDNCTENDICKRASYFMALQYIAESVHDKIHSLAEAAATVSSDNTSSDVEKIVESGTQQIAFASIHGVKIDKFFDREYWVQDGPGEPKMYKKDFFAIVSVSKRNFDEAVYETLKKEEKEVKDPHAKALIDKMDDLWLKDETKQKN